MTTLLRLAALSLLLTARSLCAAADTAAHTADVGGRSLNFPPLGEAFAEIGYDNKSRMEIMVPPQNRLVCAYALKDDLPAMSRGDADLRLKRYAMVEVLRRGEAVDCSAENFLEATSGMEEAFGKQIASSFGEAEAELNRRLKAIESEPLTLGEPKMLGILFKITDAQGAGMLTSVSQGGQTTKLAVAIVLARVNRRLIFVYLYATYEGDATVKWLGETAEAWTRQIQAANPESS